MDKPQSIDLPSSAPEQRSRVAQLASAAAAMELSSKFALVCVFFAWFFLDTLVVSVGSIKHGVRFFDAGALIADPTRMFFSIDTSFGVILFALVCIACLLAPLAPHLSRSRATWLGYLAPLALIVVCGLLLYSKTSGDMLATPSDAGNLTSSVMSFANKLLQRGSDVVSKHVGVGAGGYVALLASLVLAYTGVRRLARKSS